MIREIPERALAFLTQVEGVRLTAYRDSKGVLTIGVGHTGPEIYGGMTISLDQAMGLLKADLERAARKLAAAVRGEVIAELTDNQYIALLSFVFNLGEDPKWTIWKRLNAKAFDQVPAEMARFVNIRLKDGTVKKVPGLVARRNAEIAVWSEGEPGTLDVDLSSSSTRGIVTPPTPADPTPPGRSAIILTSVSGAVLSAPGVIKQVQDTLQPAADASPSIARVVALLTVLGAALAAVGVALIWLHKQQARS